MPVPINEHVDFESEVHQEEESQCHNKPRQKFRHVQMGVCGDTLMIYHFQQVLSLLILSRLCPCSKYGGQRF